MPRATQRGMPVTLALSPEGHLITDEGEEVSGAFAPAAEAGIRSALAQGDVSCLIWLAACKATEGLPLAALFWRELAGKYLTQFCQTGGKEPVSTPPEKGLAAFMEQAPPMRGAEYLSAAVLLRLWERLDEGVRAQSAAHPGGAEGWLREIAPHWHLVGRVTFHLAENKKDPQKPFAFLATFTSGLDRKSVV